MHAHACTHTPSWREWKVFVWVYLHCKSLWGLAFTCRWATSNPGQPCTRADGQPGPTSHKGWWTTRANLAQGLMDNLGQPCTRPMDNPGQSRTRANGQPRPTSHKGWWTTRANLVQGLMDNLGQPCTRANGQPGPTSHKGQWTTRANLTQGPTDRDRPWKSMSGGASSLVLTLT